MAKSPVLLNMRLPIENEESIASYARRLAAANHCDAASWLTDELGGRVETISQSPQIIERLADAVGSPKDDLLWHAYLIDDGLVRHSGHLFPKDALRLRHRRVCQDCLKERQVDRWWWDLAPLGACPDHGCSFHGHCPGCKAPLPASTTSVTRCRCGVDLRGAARIPASQDMVEAAQEIVAVARGRRAPRLAVPPIIGLGELLELCGVIARLQMTITNGRKRTGPVLRRSDVADLMPGAIDVLAAWPDAFVALLRDLDASSTIRGEGEGRMRTFYNTLRTVRLTGTRTVLVDAARPFLHKSAKTLPIAFAHQEDVLLKRDEVEDLLKSHTDSGEPVYRYYARSFWNAHAKRLHVYRDKHENFYSRTEVLSSIARHRTPSPSGKTAGENCDSRSSDVDLSGPRFRGNQYTRIRADGGQVSLTYQALADRIGTSIGIARPVGQAGLFALNGLDVHPSRVEEWVERTSRKLSATPADCAFVAYRAWRQTAFKLGLGEPEIMHLVDDLAFLSTATPGRFSLDSLLVPERAVVAEVNRRLGGSRTSLHRAEVERELALMPQEFDSLRRQGFFGENLAGKRLESGCLVPGDAVEYFRRNYVARRALRLPSHRHTPLEIFRPGIEIEGATAVRVHNKLRVFHRQCLNLTAIKSLTGAMV